MSACGALWKTSVKRWVDSLQLTVMMPPSGSYERLRRVMENEREALSFQFSVYSDDAAARQL